MNEVILFVIEDNFLVIGVGISLPGVIGPDIVLKEGLELGICSRGHAWDKAPCSKFCS